MKLCVPRNFFESRVKELEGALTKTKLFASSENELLPAAVELFRSLRLLEGQPDSEMSSAYSSLAVKLGADVRKTLKFATGSIALKIIRAIPATKTTRETGITNKLETRK